MHACHLPVQHEPNQRTIDQEHDSNWYIKMILLLEITFRSIITG